MTYHLDRGGIASDHAHVADLRRPTYLHRYAWPG